MGQESKHCLASSSSSIMRLQSVCQLGLWFHWKSWLREDPLPNSLMWCLMDLGALLWVPLHRAFSRNNTWLLSGQAIQEREWVWERQPKTEATVFLWPNLRSDIPSLLYLLEVSHYTHKDGDYMSVKTRRGSLGPSQRLLPHTQIYQFFSYIVSAFTSCLRNTSLPQSKNIFSNIFF